MFIEIKNARKHYGEGDALVKALDDINLSLDEGKVYVILGPSGSGKALCSIWWVDWTHLMMVK